MTAKELEELQKGIEKQIYILTQNEGLATDEIDAIPDGVADAPP